MSEKNLRVMSIMSGRGKELCEMLRQELRIPEKVRWFEVRFAVDEAISVRCDYLATEEIGKDD